MAHLVAARVAGLGPLEPLLADDAVTEVMVNGRGPVWVERAGRSTACRSTWHPAEVDLLVERIVAPARAACRPHVPIVDARLPDGSRVNVVVPPLAVDGPCVTIRRFGARASPSARSARQAWPSYSHGPCAPGRNVIVSGGTGAGKTTVLNALARSCPAGERIVTVEDTAELRLPRPRRAPRGAPRHRRRPRRGDGPAARAQRAPHAAGSHHRG